MMIEEKMQSFADDHSCYAEPFLEGEVPAVEREMPKIGVPRIQARE